LNKNDFTNDIYLHKSVQITTPVIKIWRNNECL
jgi:hypothetical protein